MTHVPKTADSREGIEVSSEAAEEGARLLNDFDRKDSWITRCEFAAEVYRAMARKMCGGIRPSG